MPHLCTEAFVQSVVLCSNSVCCAFVPLFPGVVKIQGESTQPKRNWTLPNKMQCLTPPKEGAVTSQPLEFLSKGSWSRPLRPPHSPRRDSGTMMSSVGSAAWPTARESPTVGCSLMATQQVGVLRILSTVGRLCSNLASLYLRWPWAATWEVLDQAGMEPNTKPSPLPGKHILVDSKRACGSADLGPKGFSTSRVSDLWALLATARAPQLPPPQHSTSQP